MSFFGSQRSKPSFFSDPMFAGLDMSGFDPSGLQNAIDENAAAPKPKRNFGDSTLGAIIGILGDGALGFVGQPAVYGPSIAEGRQRQQKMMEEYERRQRERAEGREDKMWEAENKPPTPFEVGNRIVTYDPREKATNVVYEGLSPAAEYAQTLGHQPGTPEYLDAIKDFVLKSNGPTGIAADREMLDRRFSNSQALKGTPTYQQTHPSPKAAGKPQYEYRMGPGGRLQKRRVN